jgi:hypothetical protein
LSIRMGLGLVGAWIGVLAAGCEVAEDGPAPFTAPEVLTEHREVVSPKAPDKQLGEDCSAYGYTECRSGLCIHAGPELKEKYFCSRACRSHSDCPKQWECQQTHPGPGGLMCVPPSGWKAKVAPTWGSAAEGGQR